MLLKTSSMSYKKYRTATLSSAKSLDLATCGLFQKTKAAWDAISVPSQAGDPTCTPTGQNSDFSLALNPSAGTVQQGGSVTTSVVTDTTTGTAQSVTLTATGLPSGVTASFNPPTVQSGQSSVLTLSASATAAPGASTVVIKGQGPRSHTPSTTRSMSAEHNQAQTRRTSPSPTSRRTLRSSARSPRRTAVTDGRAALATPNRSPM